MTVYPRLFWVTIACAVATSSHASFSVQGYAKIQDASLQTRATVTHDFDNFKNIYQELIGSITLYGAVMGQNGNSPIANMPGAAFENIINNDYRWIVTGTTQTARTQNTVLGRDILVLGDKPDPTVSSFYSSGRFTDTQQYLLVNAENEDLLESSIKFSKTLNQGLWLLSDEDDSLSINPSNPFNAVNTPTTTTHLIDPNTAFTAAADQTLSPNKIIPISYTGTAPLDGSFYQLPPENDNTPYFIVRSANSNDDMQLKYLLNRIIVAKSDAPSFAYTDYDHMNYFEVDLGVNVDFELSPSSAFGINIGITSPIEAIKHHSFYHEVTPEITIHAAANAQILTSYSQISVGTGARYDRYSTLVRTLDLDAGLANTDSINANNSRVIRTFNDQASSISQFYEISASFPIYQYVDLTISYQSSAQIDDFELLGANQDKASLHYQSFSAGLRSSFQDRAFM
jgi:hypothetical protein